MKAIYKTEATQFIDSVKTGNAMRNARKSKGHKQRYLAEIMGIKASFLNDLERGRRNWTEPMIATWNNAMKGKK